MTRRPGRFATTRAATAHMAARTGTTRTAATIVACAIAGGMLAMLTACSLFMPKLVPPQLSIVSVELGHSDLFAQHLRVRMRVQNPNDVALPVEGLEYTLDVAGAEAAQGVSSASFTVPALGEADFDMDVTANLAGTLLRLLSHGSSSDQIGYHIIGKVRLSHGLLRSVPFDKSGTFALR